LVCAAAMPIERERTIVLKTLQATDILGTSQSVSYTWFHTEGVVVVTVTTEHGHTRHPINLRRHPKRIRAFVPGDLTEHYCVLPALAILQAEIGLQIRSLVSEKTSEYIRIPALENVRRFVTKRK